MFHQIKWLVRLRCSLNKFCLSMMCQCAVTNNRGSEYRVGHGPDRDHSGLEFSILDCIFRMRRDGIDIFQNWSITFPCKHFFFFPFLMDKMSDKLDPTSLILLENDEYIKKWRNSKIWGCLPKSEKQIWINKKRPHKIWNLLWLCSLKLKPYQPR